METSKAALTESENRGRNLLCWCSFVEYSYCFPSSLVSLIAPSSFKHWSYKTSSNILAALVLMYTVCKSTSTDRVSRTVHIETPMNRAAATQGNYFLPWWDINVPLQQQHLYQVWIFCLAWFWFFWNSMILPIDLFWVSSSLKSLGHFNKYKALLF